jgi:hypothetical protein
MIRTRRRTPRRVQAIRDEKYLQFIRERRCLVCREMEGFRLNYPPSDPAHTKVNGMSSKGDDSSCVPLCRLHHTELHKRGILDFQVKYGVDLRQEALTYYGLYLLDKEDKGNGD